MQTSIHPTKRPFLNLPFFKAEDKKPTNKCLHSVQLLRFTMLIVMLQFIALETSFGQNTLNNLGLPAGVNAAAAFSIRKLSTGYAGNCIQVRRSSDNTLQNIGFLASGMLDTGSLKTFVGANAGFVRTWYDQSGNARNAVQTTNATQPKIINAGVIHYENGDPSIVFSGAQNFQTSLTAVQATNGGNKTTVSAVFKNATINSSLIANNNLGTTDRFNIHAPWADGDSYLDIGDLSGGGRVQGTSDWLNLAIGTFQRNAAVGTIWKNGVSVASSSTMATTVSSTNTMSIGSMDISSFFMVGSISELIVFPSAVSTANRQLMECNQSNFYTINDIAPPSITCPVTQTLNLGASCTAIVPVYTGLATVSDNCTAAGSIVVTQSPIAGTSVSGAGTMVVTLTARDISGNLNTCTFNVTKADITVPAIICPGVQSINLNGSCNAVLPNYTSLATVTDNCTAPGAIVVTQSPVAGTTISGSGLQLITLTATDESGNSTNCSFNLNKTDVTPPVITCPGSIVTNAAAGTCGAVVNYTVTALDACTGTSCAPSSITGYTLIGTFNGHTYFRSNAPSTWAIAKANAISVGAHLVTIASAGENAFLGGLGQHWGGMTDEVTEGTWLWVTGEPIVYTSWSPGEPNNTGNQDYMVLNWSGINWDDQGAATSLPSILEFDCLFTTRTAGPASGATFPVGVTTVSYSATDASGNTSNCSFTVTVNDNIAPLISCPANQALNLGAGCTAALPNYTALATKSDNCTATGSIVVTQSPVPGTAVSVSGTITVMLTATDASGNSSNCSFDVTVKDATAPTITCPATQTLNLSASCLAVLPDYTVLATASDNCTATGSIVVTQSPAAGTTVSDIGTQLITLTATDGAGNITTCTFNVTKADITPPVMSCPSNISVNSDPATCGAVVNYTVSAVDGCSGTSCAPGAIAGYTLLGTYGGHTYYRSNSSSTWAAANTNANALGAHLVTINSAGENTFLSTAGICWTGFTDQAVEGTWVWINGEPVTFTNWNAGEPNNSGGNEDYMHVNYSVVGGWNDIPGSSLYPAVIEFECLNLNRVAGLASGSVFPVGTTTVTYNATDFAGNTSANCSFTVTVTDNVAPTIACVNDITISAPAGACVATVNYAVPTVTDNCSSCMSAPAISGFTSLGLFNGTAYYVSTGTATFTAATSAAAAAGARLVSITSAAENTFIRNAVNATPVGGATYWAGATDILVDGTWLWSTCEPFSYTNWNTGEPNGTTSENCLQVIASGKWNDLNTAGNLYYVIEVACNGITPVRSAGLASGSDFPLGVNNITYTATDAAGNIGTRSFTVTVNANAANAAKAVTVAASPVCAGNGTDIRIALSDNGVSYQLRNNAGNVSIGSPVAGTAGTIVLPTGNISATTTFNILATNIADGCSWQLNTTPTVTVTIVPTVTPGADVNVCQSASPTAIVLSGASVGGGATNGTWSIVSGGGTLSYYGATATPATVTYTPVVNFTGTVTLRLTTNAPSPCAAVNATRDIVVDPRPVITGPAMVCVASSISLTPATGGTWTSSNPARATITNAGVVDGLMAGTVTFTHTITATGCSRTSGTITVNALPVVTAGTMVCVGSSITLSPTSGGTWTSANNAIATVTNAGVVTGAAAGSTTFTYTQTSTGCSNTTDPVTVNALPVIVVPSTLCIGTGAASLSPSTGGTWVSSNLGRATVTAAGIVNALSTGTVIFTFTETATGCSKSSATVTINALPVVSTSASVVCEGGTITASPSSGGTWISNDNAVASVTNAGVITGIAAGSTTFTYTQTSTGCSRTTASVTINPAAVVDPGATLTICRSGTPAALTLTGASVGGSASTGAWSVIAGGGTLSSTAQTATPATVTYTPAANFNGTVTLQLITNDPAGPCVAVSATRTIIINPLIVTNVINSAQNICTGTTPTPFTGSTPTGGDGSSYTYQWRSSTTSGSTGFSAAAGVRNGIDYTPGVLTQTTWYRRVVTSGGCSSNSVSIQILVDPLITNNSISSDQSICPGSTPAVITGAVPGGGGGAGSYIYYWESSTTSASTGFSVVSGVFNGIDYTPGVLTQNTWYRRTVSSGGCTHVSTPVLITMYASGQWVGGATGNWNVSTNWCGGVPSAASNVTIPSGTTVNIQSADAVAAGINIIGSGSLVMTGAYNLTISSGGSFINNGTFNATANTGTVAFLGNSTIIGTTIFNNIDTYGALDFGTASTVSGIFSIQTGGSVTGHSPSYSCPTAVLAYKPGSIFTRGLEWTTASSGPGYPANVRIQNNTTIDFPATGDGSICYDLQIDSASSLRQNYGGGSASLRVGRNITISGTLALGDAAGGDISLGGNWVRNIGGIFTANDRKVTFDGPANFSGNGTSMSIISAPASSAKDNEGGFGGEKFAHIWLNKSSASDSVVLLSNVTVTRELGLTRGTFSLGNSDVTLVSNATRTADVAPVVTAADVNIRYAGTGKFAVQRFIQNPTATRSWRLLTAPLQSSKSPSINAAYMEGVINPNRSAPNASSGAYNPSPGFGTHITGPGGSYSAANGFDHGTSSSSILYAGAGVNNWLTPTSTLTTKVTDQQGWMLFVRGDRGFTIGNQYTPSQNTTLEPKGRINIGDVTIALPAGRHVIGNPYPSAISLMDIDVAGTPGNSSSYHMWDPKMFTSYTQPGKWVSFSGLGSSFVQTTSASPYADNGIVESGQAFLLDVPGAGTVTFHESDKLPLTSSLIGIANATGARPANNEVYPMFRTDIYAKTDTSFTLTDGVLNIFHPTFETSVNSADAKKYISFNSKENLSILRDAVKIAIEKRSELQHIDTIFYSMANFNLIPYRFKFEATDIPYGYEAFLEDNFTGIRTPVSTDGVSEATFNISTNPLSKAPDRFRVVFKSSIGVVLPVTFTGVKAWQQNNDIAVQWQVENQTGIRSYDVEKSLDGISFEKVNTTYAQGNYAGSLSYNWLDVTPVRGNNYYRIRSYSNDGRSKLSKMVKVNISQTNGSITVYPNPVTENVIKLNFLNTDKGTYQLRLLNIAGQAIQQTTYTLPGGDAAQTMLLEKGIAKGSYNLEIFRPNNTKSVIKVIIQ